MASPSRERIVAVARERLAEILELPLDQVTVDADLEEELDVDSLQQLELAVVLEDEFGVVLDADDLSEVRTIGGIAEKALGRLGVA